MSEYRDAGLSALRNGALTQQNLNAIYNSQKVRTLAEHMVDWPFSLAVSVDSFGGIGTVQGHTAVANQLTPPVGSQNQLVDPQRFPGPNAALIHFISYQCTSQDLTLPSVVQILFSWTDPTGRTRPLFIFDSRAPYPPPDFLDLTYPLVIVDSGLNSFGEITGQVLATTASAAHPVTYNIILQTQVLYQVDDPPLEARLSQHTQALIEAINHQADPWRDIVRDLVRALPGIQEKDPQSV